VGVQLSSIVLLLFMCVSAWTQAAGAVANAAPTLPPGVSAEALRAGTEAAEAIFARGAVAAADGGGGYYMDQIEEALTTLANVSLLRISDDTLIVRIDPSDLFDRDATVMHIAGRTLLGNMAEKLRYLPKAAVVIQVHTDAGPDEKRNMRRSGRRAKSIMDHLEGYGMEGKRVAAFGYGDRYPLPPGQLSSARVNILFRTR
jgi:outer membrane protein OmpA-like peptidoglycan-associated protein